MRLIYREQLHKVSWLFENRSFIYTSLEMEQTNFRESIENGTI